MAPFLKKISSEGPAVTDVLTADNEWSVSCMSA